MVASTWYSGFMDKYEQLKELMEYVTKTVIDLPYPYRNPDGDNDYHHVVRLIMNDVKTAMEKIDNGI
jgi:hypothetical protein